MESRKNNSPRKILVTAALPYANGPIHIGHLVEYIQTDIWVRFQKLRGHQCIFIWADDTHGTAIMKSARDHQCSEEEFIARMSTEHQRDFRGFQIEWDHYGSTHSDANRLICHEIWSALNRAGLVVKRQVVELFDAETGEALPDRFVKGKCPKCLSPGQYGDNCDKCGHTYRATDLVEPISALSGKPPVEGATDHFFVRIEELHDFLEDWTAPGVHLQEEVSNYLRGHFLSEPLRDWDVSRPAPYFGFTIPETDNQHYWYVWFDAPIGYIASTKEWCDLNNQKLDDWWRNDDVEIHHFLGKDIQYFHCLFWPAMLKTAGFNLPTREHIHGFLTVNGEKMSKTKGTFIKAETYLRYLDPAYLRYFYAAKLGSRLDDIDLNFNDFKAKVDTDLVNKVVNLASRSAKFVEAIGLSPTYPDDGGLFAQAAAAGERIAEHYEECEFSQAMRLIMELADRANPFVENAQPWVLHKDPSKVQELQEVCTIALNLFRQIAIYLAPVLPEFAERVGALFNDPIVSWKQSQSPLVGRSLSKFTHLLKRVELKDIEAMIEASKQTEATPTPAHLIDDATQSTTVEWQDSDEALQAEPLAAECSIDDFARVDLRVARIIEAEHVPEAKKLLKLKLSLGGDNVRTVFAGIKAAYEPAQLVGRLVVMVANLKPREMKFGTSEGMVCAAGSGGSEVYLLAADSGAVPGQRVH
ncbi:MAG TPA: methionine--tRNA ligase [Pirellulaceae bacterium]|nr:methionine--tRNA ligase [Pirellulaceae bacterium]HMO93727.1 methionine--tRNA ligase [Pirellulaceae bacterium]HMP69770.1 methionine--tRNA ligase [Pirellulaceae bacterium]